MSVRTYDIVIIGGGIVGALCALECVRERLSVCVVERSVIGGGATAAGMGHIVVMDDSEAQFALTRRSQLLWNTLAANLPPEVEYRQTGTIWVAADEEEMAEVHRKREFYAVRRVPVEVLDGKQLAEAEPNLRPGLAGGLLVKEDGVIYPPCAAQHFLNAAKFLGADVRAGSTVSAIESGKVLLEDGSRIAGSRFVNAMGSWAPDLTPGIDVQGRKGHLAITERAQGFVYHQLVELGYLKSAHSLTSDSVAFNVQPRATGQVLIGSSRQYGTMESGIDHAMLAKMLNRAIEYMPGLAALKVVRTWTGFRAATPDKLPLIGPHPHIEQLFLATGHEGLGITTAPITATLLADQLLGRESVIPREPYLPSRMLPAPSRRKIAIS